MNKYYDSSWDFKSAETKSYTHCFHAYPAMMIPQIAGRLIEMYGKANSTLLDPYCGTGTSVVEANLRQINAIATDLNPLARLITRAKSSVVDIQVLDLFIKDFSSFVLKKRFGELDNSFEVPNFPNIDFWFTTEVKEELSFIKSYIDKIEDCKISDFFKVAFSETIREVSLTKNSEFKLVRMKQDQLRKFSPEPIFTFERKLFRNRNGLKQFIDKVKRQKKNLVFEFDCTKDIPNELIIDESVDIIVTSPPYGDSRTTVAYGQFSRLSNQWMGVENANILDTISMGGKRSQVIEEFGLEILDQQIQEIATRDERRALEVIGFYRDYRKSISSIAKKLKRGGTAAYVVGNRRVKDLELPTDSVTAHFFEENGLSHSETIIRKIPNKRMPKENSPSNIVGKKSTTMNCEYIVIMKKE